MLTPADKQAIREMIAVANPQADIAQYSEEIDRLIERRALLIETVDGLDRIIVDKKLQLESVDKMVERAKIDLEETKKQDAKFSETAQELANIQIGVMTQETYALLDKRKAELDDLEQSLNAKEVKLTEWGKKLAKFEGELYDNSISQKETKNALEKASETFELQSSAHAKENELLLQRIKELDDREVEILTQETAIDEAWSKVHEREKSSEKLSAKNIEDAEVNKTKALSLQKSEQFLKEREIGLDNRERALNDRVSVQSPL